MYHGPKNMVQIFDPTFHEDMGQQGADPSSAGNEGVCKAKESLKTLYSAHLSKVTESRGTRRDTAKRSPRLILIPASEV